MVLITGASGLLGLHLLKVLSAAGTPVRAMYRSRKADLLPGSVSDNIEWVQGDVLDHAALDAALQGVQQVYHAAAMVSYDARDRDLLMEVNAEGTARVVDACLAHGVKKLLFVSSIATLGDEPWPGLISEDTPRREEGKRSVYAQSKYRAEMEVWRGMAEGLQAVIVNPSVMLGEGDWTRSSTALFRIVHDEFPFYTTGCTGWVDAQDVARACVLLMNSEIQGERFVLNGGNLAYREVFTLMARAMGKKPPRYEAKPWMAALVWRWQVLRGWLTGKRATITRETARSAREEKGYSSAKFLQVFQDFRWKEVDKTVTRVCGAIQKNLLV
jgi:dihydroflavonol-4-reductase